MRRKMVLAAAAFAVAVPAYGQEHAAHGAAGEKAPSMCMMHAMAGGGGMQHGAQGGMQAGAQGGMQHGGGQKPAQMSHGMDHYITQPGRLLHHREELGLTADQVSRIEALQAAAGTDCAQHMEMARESHAAANEALNAATPDVQAFEARLREAASHMVQGHTAAVRRGVEALNVLTADQREKLKSASHGKH